MSHDTWLHKISRIIIVRPLMKTKVTPNHLTTIRLIAGCLAALLMGVGSEKFLFCGAGIFFLSIFLDRADGDLARLSGQTSSFGHNYDLMADSVSNIFFFVGLGVGLRSGEYGLLSVPMGLVSGMAIAGILALVIKLERVNGARAGELKSFYGFDPDDIMLLLPVVICSGKADLLLLLASIGAPMFLVFFYYFYRAKIRTKRNAS